MPSGLWTAAVDIPGPPVHDPFAVCNSNREMTMAVVRAEWAERMDVRRKELNLAQEFADEGRSYVELDDNGLVVRREPAVGQPPLE